MILVRPLLGDKRPWALRMIAKIADMAGRTYAQLVVVRCAALPEVIFVPDAGQYKIVGGPITAFPFPLDRPRAIIRHLEARVRRARSKIHSPLRARNGLAHHAAEHASKSRFFLFRADRRRSDRQCSIRRHMLSNAVP